MGTKKIGGGYNMKEIAQAAARKIMETHSNDVAAATREIMGRSYDANGGLASETLKRRFKVSADPTMLLNIDDLKHFDTNERAEVAKALVQPLQQLTDFTIQRLGLTVQENTNNMTFDILQHKAQKTERKLQHKTKETIKYNEVLEAVAKIIEQQLEKKAAQEKESQTITTRASSPSTVATTHDITSVNERAAQAQTTTKNTLDPKHVTVGKHTANAVKNETTVHQSISVADRIKQFEKPKPSHEEKIKSHVKGVVKTL